MPFVYTDQLATPGNLTTSGTPNTETEAFFLKPGSTRSLYLAAVQIGGKGGGVTQLSGISLRVFKWGTASTAGTALSIVAKDASMPAATITGSSRPTSGTTRTNAGPIVTCGATSPGVPWVALNPDHMVSLAAGNAGSISAMDSGAVASMPYEFSLEHQEW
ncbi:MAG TPA: hypothetical protein VFT22_07290 [Kofleriaceae bacterium]|nr:hypothetical protein [Kofleriaceae bacterium]